MESEPPPTPTPPKPARGLPGRAAFSMRARAHSFVYAFRGMWALFRREHNAWIHLAASAAAGVAGAWWRIDRVEWALVALAIFSVLAAEAINTAVETLADAVRPEHDLLVGRAKDLAAAAVLLASIGAAVVGLLVFGPHLWAEYVRATRG